MITSNQFLDAWDHAPLNEIQRSAILGVYEMPNHEATATQLAALLGDRHYSGANLHFGGAAHVISEISA